MDWEHTQSGQINAHSMVHLFFIDFEIHIFFIYEMISIALRTDLV